MKTSYYFMHREERAEYDKKRYDAKREHILAQKKQHYKEHRDEILAKKRAYYLKHLDEKRVYDRNRWIERSEYRKIWEDHFRVKIPEGYLIHHKDCDWHNNNPINLLCLPMDEHIRLHAAIKAEAQ